MIAAYSVSLKVEEVSTVSSSACERGPRDAQPVEKLVEVKTAGESARGNDQSVGSFSACMLSLNL